jgi:hypothetical protein
MTKYIIKNCPALRGWVCNEQFIKQDKMIDCQDCTDCLLKQIVELCKDAFRWQYAATAHDAQLRYAKAEFANELLSKLDIEEVE